MDIQLSDSFNYKKLLRFTFPSIVMMVFTSIYMVVDGFFVSNFVGKVPFAAINFIVPILIILASVGMMFGSGGSALVSKTLGEGNEEKARNLFSLVVYTTIVFGIIIAVIAFLVIEPIVYLVGARGELLKNCVSYGKIILFAVPFYMILFEFQSFFVTAGKPNIGLITTVICGVTNIVLDILFMGVFSWGISGAAIATTISQIIGAVISVLYFCIPNNTALRLTKTKMDVKALLKSCSNGCSEFMNNISISIVGMLYNFQLMKYAGENGIAVYGVLMYVNTIFLSVFIGYSSGIAPVIGYNYGAKNHSELKRLLTKSFVIISIFAVIMFGMAEFFGGRLASIFVGYDSELLNMATKAFKIYSISFLFSGVAIYGSSFFTALNDGLTSALISFLRSLVFQIIAVIVFPMIFGINGIWFSVVAAEIIAVIMTVSFIIGKRKKYHYL